MNASAEIAAIAARLVVDEGMEYAGAKRRAARDLGARVALPGNEEVEDAVREHIALFHAETQPAELHALRALALQWMERLAEFRPHLSGAAWRGTATRLSALHLDLYCDDSKAPEIALVNAGIDYDGAALDRPGRREPLPLLTLAAPCPALGAPVTLHLLLHDADEQRGALKPDARGRSWRGDAAALRRLIQADGSGPASPQAANQDTP
ncbi:MAG: hypothetical protein KGO01_22140 [Burkholderiales bacterium]|nr:hypothetical protein [Burkholderiales bacterium]MDE1928763.1 hypothetical protein [Burkholderiales bacterium]